MAIDVAATLSLIRRYETGGGTDPAGANVYNYKYSSNPKLYSASGYYQITNTLWKEKAPAAGVDLGQYPTAISAPYEVQTSVAQSIVQQPGGIGNWTCCNPRLVSALASANGGIVPSQAQPDLQDTLGDWSARPANGSGSTYGAASDAYTPTLWDKLDSAWRGITGAAKNPENLPGGTNSPLNLSNITNYVTKSAPNLALFVFAALLLFVAVWPAAKVNVNLGGARG